MRWPASAAFLRAFFTTFGVTGNPSVSVEDTVIPVSVVDNETVQVASTPVFGVPASAGETSGPAANTRLANTGAQPAGNYTALFIIMTGTEGNSFRIRRRNAGDTADIWSVRVNLSATFQMFQLNIRIALASNEFVVIENVSAGTAGVIYQAAIFMSAG